MREISSYNMIPIPCANLNENLFNCGPTSFISSNGYYGYQPQIHHSRLKNANQQLENERPISNERVQIQMDVGLNNAMETEVQVENSISLAHQHRQTKKRRWEHVEHMEGFKKRRESQDVIKDLKINIAKDDHQDSLLEDILRETHGVSIYHWLDK